MKHDWKTRSVAALVGLLGAFGGMGVVTSGLGFWDVPMRAVFLACLLGALAAAMLAGRKLFFVLPLILCVFTFVAWRRLGLERSLEALLYFATRLYNSGYGWGFIRWSSEPLTTDAAALAVCFLGMWLSLAITGGFLNKGGVWLGAFAAALPLLPCMVLTDTVPEAKWLYLQLLSLLLLLFCSRAPRRGLYLTLPVALALGVLFLAMPRETYKGQDAAERVGKYLEEWFSQEEPGGTQEIPIDMPDISGFQVDLSNTGPRPSWRIPVMDVKAQDTGTLYLRSMAYDTYTGTRWDADDDEALLGFFTTPGTQKIMELETRTVHDTLYLPYGAQSAYSGHQVLEDAVRGRVENTKEVRSYSVTYSLPYWSQVADLPVTGFQSTTGDEVALPQVGGQTVQIETPWSRYLALPEETRVRAEEWLENNLSGQVLSAQEVPQWALAQAICDAVSRSASYDLSTQRMPAGEDFAMWFLEESETGYCVHFASAAAVLLRAAGIPSRYVSGYVASCVSGETVTVYQKNAHAWVEVYIVGFGWVMLEPTPGDGVQDTAGETTAPPETTAETTGPSQTTDESTLPTTTEPDQTVTEPAQPSPTGGTEGPDVPEPPKPPKPMPKWLKGVLWALAAVGAVVLQWRLRVALRQRSRRKGTLNRQVLVVWREAVLCARLLKTKPTEEFHTLAQRAKFSQHAITRLERAHCEASLNAMKHHLKTSGILKRFVATLVLALY